MGYYEVVGHRDVPSRFNVGSESFNENIECGVNGRFCIAGHLYNTNTANEFRELDKMGILRESMNEVWSSILDKSILEKEGELLNTFVLCTFSDLKKHSFVYWFGFPALVPNTPFVASDGVFLKEAFSVEEQNALCRGVLNLSRKSKHSLPYFLVLNIDGEMKIKPLSCWKDYSVEMQEQIMFGYVDPCPLKSNPGWPLRNYLALIFVTCKVQQPKIISFRENIAFIGDSMVACTESLMWTVRIGGECTVENVYSNCMGNNELQVTGWETNARGKLGPRQVRLGALMDPLKLAESSSNLNLKLMRWRQLPSLSTELLSNTKCLLLGAGTLGCNVARCLLGWGIRNMTFVDNSVVSYSNPVRQSLFEFSDCANGGKPKSIAAAESILRICPYANTKGVQLSIPMPGHPMSTPKEVETGQESLQTLKDLISSHDVIFLGTDSRESRWLPTLIASSMDKMLMNTALGFDTFVVMRHGGGITSKNRLGCYFCNDIVAPENSLRDRTLDQMCTVTRPGLAPIASSIAVELSISLLHSENKHHHPAYIIPSVSESLDPNTTSLLGAVPHQIRGYLSHFQNQSHIGLPFEKCTACSPTIIKEFEKHPFQLLQQVCENSSILEDLTGITQLRTDTDIIDFDVDDSDDDSSM